MSAWLHKSKLTTSLSTISILIICLHTHHYPFPYGSISTFILHHTHPDTHQTHSIVYHIFSLITLYTHFSLYQPIARFLAHAWLPQDLLNAFMKVPKLSLPCAWEPCRELNRAPNL